MPYRWGFPIQLTVHKGNDSFTLRHHAGLPDLFGFLEMDLITLRDWLSPLPSREFRMAPQAAPAGLTRCSSRCRREPTQIGRGDPEL